MKKIVLLALAMGFMVSCESRTYADLAVEVPNPTYEANIKSVMDANCVSCHFDGGDFPPLTSYVQVKEAALNGEFLCKINAQCGVMPASGKMPQATVDMINLWAQQGYAEK